MLLCFLRAASLTKKLLLQHCVSVLFATDYLCNGEQLEDTLLAFSLLRLVGEPRIQHKRGKRKAG